ncbi:ABC transporter ATP-binding protein [Candidatus Bathyarchaeota archaeon]|nr:ABC transporter ATP-binding protein [Candidatus Bathyarchaeota archaeon]
MRAVCEEELLSEAISTKQLSKQYGSIWAVRDLNLEVKHGEIFGFLGPNGAGKTTTIRMLTTLTKPTYGQAWVDGYNVLKEPDKVRKAIGVMQQHLSLDRDLTVRENMELRARLHHFRPHERNKRINELLEYVGLTEHANRPIDTLSGGLQRRAMIACALIHQPKILFLDEPTVGLDAHTRRRMWDLIRRLNADGVTIFLTTHYIEEAEALCHRVGIIHEGSLIALGSPMELRQKVGMYTVVTIVENGNSSYRYFPDRESATRYVEMLPPNVKTIIVRESNLEDVFIELTGRGVEEN